MSHPRKRISRRRFLKLAGVAAAVGVVPFGLTSTNWLSVERRDLRLPRWDADGFKVAFLSDFHLHSPELIELADRAIELALLEKPDVILLGGDYTDSSAHKSTSIEKCLRRLGDASCPVFGVLGNHDYWVRSPPAVIRGIQAAPFRLLRNEHAEVQGVTIMGLDDALMNRHEPAKTPTLGVASKSLICLLHEPDFVTVNPDHVSLQISGHSHGGQICLPGGIGVHTPRGAKKYKSGFYEDAKVPLYVSRGVGTTGPHLRMYCRPEVSILTLRGA